MNPLIHRIAPLRVLLEILVGTGMIFFIMFLWYITQPIVISIIVQTKQVADNMGLNNSYLNAGVTILTWIEYWWGPILIISISILWWYLAAGRRDWESSFQP